MGIWNSIFAANPPFENPLVIDLFGSQTTERAFIEIPIMDKDIIVKCEGRQISVMVMQSYIDRNEKWLQGGQKLSLIDTSCKAVDDGKGNRVIKVRDDFTKCKNKIEVESDESTDGTVVDTYVIKNKLIYDDPRGFIDRQIDLLEFDCRYPATQLTSEFMQPWLLPAAKENIVKNLAGLMMLYKDANYTDPYMSPPMLTLDDQLYIQITLEKPLISNIDQTETDIAVVMEYCWGTPSSDPLSELNKIKYYMIKDGCPVDDPSLHIVSNGDSLKSKFDIKMFKFIGDDLTDVWMYCSVRACNATIPENCRPDCDNRQKRQVMSEKAKKKKLWYVSKSHEITAELPIQRSLTNDQLQKKQSEFSNQNPLDNFLIEFKSSSTLITSNTIIVTVLVIFLTFI